MAWILRDQEMKAVTGLNGARRCEYLAKRVADTKQLWSLKSADGWVQMCDDAGAPLFPIWPHERYAEACATADWADCKPAAISLESWLRAWSPGLEQDNRKVAVFPVPGGSGVVMASRELESALREELANYES